MSTLCDASRQRHELKRYAQVLTLVDIQDINWFAPQLRGIILRHQEKNALLAGLRQAGARSANALITGYPDAQALYQAGTRSSTRHKGSPPRQSQGYL